MEHVPHDPDGDTEAVDGVHLAQLAAGDETSVQHFTIDPGAAVPAHDHPHEQAGFITAGELTFVLEDGEEVVCEAGDSYVLAGDEVHGAENRGETVVKGVDIFSPPRTNPDWQE